MSSGDLYVSAFPKRRTQGTDGRRAAVVGGGNSTPIFAALAKQAGYRVAILTRRPADWTADVGFVNEGARARVYAQGASAHTPRAPSQHRPGVRERQA